MITIEEIKNKPSLTVEQAAEVLGLGRRAAYNAVHEGSIPSLRIGGRIIIPTRPLLALLGCADAQ